MGVGDFPAQKEISELFKVAAPAPVFLSQIRACKFKKKLVEVRKRPPQRGEVLPGHQALPLCRSAALGFGRIQSQGGSGGKEGGRELQLLLLCGSQLCPAVGHISRGIIFASLLQVVADLPGVGPRGSHVISCGTGGGSSIGTVVALVSFFPRRRVERVLLSCILSCPTFLWEWLSPCMLLGRHKDQ